MRFSVTSNDELILVILIYLNPSKSTTIDGQVVLISVAALLRRRQKTHADWCDSFLFLVQNLDNARYNFFASRSQWPAAWSKA